MTIETKLLGDTSRVVVCQLGPDQCVYAEAGRFLWKTVNVAVTTRVHRPPAGVQGASPGSSGSRFLHRALVTASEVGKRVLPADSILLQRYTANGDGLVAFAGIVPGVVRTYELSGRHGWYVEQDAFIAAESTVDFELAFAGARAGRRVADSLVLQQFRGVGTLIVGSAGELIELNPAKYGGVLQVDPGCLVAFEDTIGYAVERLGAVDGEGRVSARAGDGPGLVTLEGDGQVLLQSLSLDGMVAAITRRGARDGQAGLFGD